jgi:hypothetical protein
MTEAALLEMVRKVLLSRRQELYDFARFLVDTYGDVKSDEKIGAFESEDEMLDFINDIGGAVYAD